MKQRRPLTLAPLERQIKTSIQSIRTWPFAVSTQGKTRQEAIFFSRNYGQLVFYPRFFETNATDHQRRQQKENDASETDVSSVICCCYSKIENYCILHSSACVFSFATY